ncbi:MAG: hypothetical protein KME20_01375 [Kaiparowitsia implicata GSE-PSE-MK54-09C]|jgi:hypothetical protein|nr:hypothetical protein [Kaiparowitsia implicata GSE-PSE-MK54-09C]
MIIDLTRAEGAQQGADITNRELEDGAIALVHLIKMLMKMQATQKEEASGFAEKYLEDAKRQAMAATAAYLAKEYGENGQYQGEDYRISSQTTEDGKERFEVFDDEGNSILAFEIEEDAVKILDYAATKEQQHAFLSAARAIENGDLEQMRQDPRSLRSLAPAGTQALYVAQSFAALSPGGAYRSTDPELKRYSFHRMEDGAIEIHDHERSDADFTVLRWKDGKFERNELDRDAQKYFAALSQKCYSTPSVPSVGTAWNQGAERQSPEPHSSSAEYEEPDDTPYEDDGVYADYPESDFYSAETDYGLDPDYKDDYSEQEIEDTGLVRSAAPDTGYRPTLGEINQWHAAATVLGYPADQLNEIRRLGNQLASSAGYDSFQSALKADPEFYSPDVTMPHGDFARMRRDLEFLGTLEQQLGDGAIVELYNKQSATTIATPITSVQAARAFLNENAEQLDSDGQFQSAPDAELDEPEDELER